MGFSSSTLEQYSSSRRTAGIKTASNPNRNPKEAEARAVYGSSASTYRSPVIPDLILTLVVAGLVCFSLVMIYSTTGTLAQERFGDPLFYVKRQGIAALLGTFLLVFASRLSIQTVRRVSPYLFFLSVALLLATILSSLGSAEGGAKRWMSFAGWNIQPAEFVKVFFVIFLAGFCARHQDRLGSFVQGIVKPCVPAVVLCALLLAQPDFGSSAILCLVTVAILLVSGARLRYLLILGSAFAVSAAVLIATSPYRMARVLSFMTPMADESGKGYQLIQSLTAVGSGQLSGLGLGAGKQKLFYLPAAHTDFIFAVIAEELGFIGCISLVILFLVVLWRGVTIAKRYIEDTFCFALSVGLTLLIVLPAFINFCVVLGLLPTKGLVLPLVGYGGSSLMASLLVVGLLLGLAKNLRD